MWVFLLSILAFAAPASKLLRYENGGDRYAIEKSAKEIVLYGTPANLRISLKECNREVTDILWQDIERKIKLLPEIAKRTTATTKSVELGGKKRSLFAMSTVGRKAARYFENLPQTFLDAKLTSERKCKP
jgi:hypothetical protein